MTADMALTLVPKDSLKMGALPPLEQFIPDFTAGLV